MCKTVVRSALPFFFFFFFWHGIPAIVISEIYTFKTRAIHTGTRYVQDILSTRKIGLDPPPPPPPHSYPVPHAHRLYTRKQTASTSGVNIFQLSTGQTHHSSPNKSACAQLKAIFGFCYAPPCPRDCGTLRHCRSS